MNYLGHLLLAGDDPVSIIGNLAGDAFRGRLDDLPKELGEAVRLHRFVDAFTDAHPATAASRRRLPEYRHYSRVLVDVFYDYVLAREWERSGRVPFAPFAEHVYQTIEEHSELIPELARGRFVSMARAQWLASYSEIKGIRRSLRGLGRRTSRGADLESATANLEADYDDYAADCELMLLDLLPAVEKFRLR